MCGLESSRPERVGRRVVTLRYRLHASPPPIGRGKSAGGRVQERVNPDRDLDIHQLLKAFAVSTVEPLGCARRNPAAVLRLAAAPAPLVGSSDRSAYSAQCFGS